MYNIVITFIIENIIVLLEEQKFNCNFDEYIISINILNKMVDLLNID